MPCSSGSCGEGSGLGSRAELGFAPEIQQPVNEAEMGMSGLGQLRGRRALSSTSQFAHAIDALRDAFIRHPTIDIVARPVFEGSAVTSCGDGRFGCSGFQGTVEEEPAEPEGGLGRPPRGNQKICCEYCSPGNTSEVIYRKEVTCVQNPSPQEAKDCCNAVAGGYVYCGWQPSCPGTTTVQGQPDSFSKASSNTCCVEPYPELRDWGKLECGSISDYVPNQTAGLAPIKQRGEVPGADRYLFEIMCPYIGKCEKCSATLDGVLGVDANKQMALGLNLGRYEQAANRTPRGEEVQQPPEVEPGGPFVDITPIVKCCNEHPGYLHFIDAPGGFDVPGNMGGAGSIRFTACFHSDKAGDCDYKKCCITFDYVYKRNASRIVPSFTIVCTTRNNKEVRFSPGT